MQTGEDVSTLSDMERLLRCESTLAHEQIAHVLWEAHSDHDAVQQLQSLGNDHLGVWEAATGADMAFSDDEDRAEG